MKCFVATGNSGKLHEIIEVGKLFFPQINSWIGRAPLNAIETEATFMGNARIKSQSLSSELKSELNEDFWVIADDSGIEVDALNGRPGVLSARYAGDHVEAQAHIQKLLGELENKTERGAQYHCALSLIIFKNNQESHLEAEGICRGEIIKFGKGSSGFGYDPIFFVPEYGKTMAELDASVKNKISHRYSAFEAMAKKVN